MASLIAPLPWWPVDAPRTETAIGSVQVAGRVVACDPCVIEAAPVPFAMDVPLGEHPVRLGRADGDLAYAALVLGDAAVASWRHAFREGEREGAVARETRGFDVNASTATFVDREAGVALHASHRRTAPIFERLVAAGYDERPWARVAIDDRHSLLAFGTGGKGNFPSFWGLDVHGAPVLLVIDFGALGDLDDEASDDRPLARVIPFPGRRR